MIVNNLSAVSRIGLLAKDSPKDAEIIASSIVLKINIEKRVSSFEETLIISFLRAFKISFQLETNKVPTFRGCKP